MYKYEGTDATPTGEWTDGNLLLGIARTIFRAAWPNMVQRELLNLVVGGGITPNRDQYDQALQAVRAIAADYGAPVGTVFGIYATTAPSGYVVPNGTLVSRASYPRLWAHAQLNGLVLSEATWAISGNHTFFSSGDGSTTFRLPELRAEHIRFADGGRGIVAGLTVGKYLPEMVGPHRHLVFKDQTNGAGAVMGSNHTSVRRANDTGGDNYDYRISGDTGIEPDVGRTGLGTGTENRVRAVALLPIMKV